MTRSLAAPQTPAAALLALALAATASVGALPAAGASSAPLERVVVLGAHAADDVVRAGGSLVEDLPLVGGVGALLPRGAVLPAGDRVVPDRPLSVSSTATGAVGTGSSLRATLGLGAPHGEGAGVRVAVVDTGVAEVDGLRGRVEHQTVVGDEGEDGVGHGTFIAGLIAGDGGAAGPGYAGVAPAADILDVKVADAEGDTGLLDVLRGLQRVAADGHVDVLNLSLSSGSPLPTALDPLTVALDRLWADGITVVVPSGNDPSTVSSPGSDRLLLTVGGLADGGTADRADDTVADWSGRGRSKPDLAAPGQSVVSVLAPGSVASRQTPVGVPEGYGFGSGTSFATGVVSGAAAALLGSRRDLTPGQVKALVTDTAYRSGGLKRSDVGAGGLDLAAALAARTPKDSPAHVDDLPAGDAAAWEAFVSAVLDDDQAAAASSWSRLSPQARQWVARQWVSVDDADRGWAARQWVARQWTARQWVGNGADEQEWLARQWVARQWVARQWVARQWTDADWTARQWTARQWTARQWTGDDWSARQWTARQWTARQWSTVSWG